MIAGAGASMSQDTDALIVVVRAGLRHPMYHNINDLQDSLFVITLGHDLEWILQDAMQTQYQTGIGT